MNVTEEMLLTIRQIQESLKSDMTDILQGEKANSFEAYLEILKQLQQILQKSGHVIRNAEKREQGIAMLYHQIQSEDDLYAYYEAFRLYLDDVYEKALLTGNRYAIIRREDTVPGIGSHIITNIGQIEAALQAGMIPVIDTVSVDNCFRNMSMEYNTNAWELFFEQPLGVGIMDIPNDAEVMVLDGIPVDKPYYDMDFFTNPYILNRWRRRANQYLRPSDQLKDALDIALAEINQRMAEKVLGVLCRGTDYVSLKPYNHPVQPSVSEMLQKAGEMLHCYKLEHIYLVTEDEGIRRAFEECFGDRVFTTQKQYYASAPKKLLTEINQETKIDCYYKNMEYLAALLLLGKCDCFLGSRTSGTVAALIMGQKEQVFETWNYGRYHVDDRWQIW